MVKSRRNGLTEAENSELRQVCNAIRKLAVPPAKPGQETYRASVWVGKDTPSGWRVEYSGFGIWSLREVLRRLYLDGWDRDLSMLVERERPKTKADIDAIQLLFERRQRFTKESSSEAARS